MRWVLYIYATGWLGLFPIVAKAEWLLEHPRLDSWVVVILFTSLWPLWLPFWLYDRMLSWRKQ
jgi:hypothetical protein